MTIGEIIYTKRKALDLTLEDIGKAVGVSKATVSRWESGDIRPRSGSGHLHFNYRNYHSIRARSFKSISRRRRPRQGRRAPHLTISP